MVAERVAGVGRLLVSELTVIIVRGSRVWVEYARLTETFCQNLTLCPWEKGTDSACERACTRAHAHTHTYIRIDVRASYL